MRVIAGIAKRIRLKAVDGDATRPVLDRVKESLFSLLFAQGRLDDAQVLDLYAGSGSLGIDPLAGKAATGSWPHDSAGEPWQPVHPPGLST